LGFLLWAIWKERSYIIFNYHHKSLEEILQSITQNITERILAKKWYPDDLQVAPHEARILTLLNLSPNMISLSLWKILVSLVVFPQHFYAPPKYFSRLSFDGASKGNPVIDGFGGLFLDSQKRTKLVFAVDFGFVTNNEVELNVVKQEILRAIRIGNKNLVIEGDSKLVIEGDSKLVIEIIKKFNLGARWENLSHNWRIS